MALKSAGLPPLPQRAGLRSLLRVALAALRFRPPLYLRAIFGPVGTWFSGHRPMSEFTIVDRRRFLRTISFLVSITVPSFAHRAPPWVARWLPRALVRLFWRPTTVFSVPADGDREPAAGAERWFFINGVATTRAVARLNGECLRRIFGRRLAVIHNTTNSLFLDLWESAIGKEFKDDPRLEVPESFTAPSLVATVTLLAAVKESSVSKVVVVAHSQGTIIVANALRAVARALWAEAAVEAETAAGNRKRAAEAVRRVAVGLARDLPPRLDDLARRFEDALVDLAAAPEGALDRLAKLEIYTFANCADTMKTVGDHDGVPVPWLEHFANERDLVARLGVLSPLRDREGVIDIDGPLYLRPAGRRPVEGGWGHLLNQHYLFAILDYFEALGSEHPIADPFPQAAGCPSKPRLYNYVATAGATPAKEAK